MAMRKAVGFLGRRDDLPEGLAYSLKRRLLGPPMVNEELGEQRLSKVLALGVLAPDGISSSAYGTEEILIELLKGGLGIAAFTLILPLTGVVLFVMALVVLSYREVVTVYTRAGGSYVVARDNFGPRVAQIAAVALLIDYVVTVAVQVAAGTAAVASAVPAINSPTIITVISIGIVILMCYGNLRGIREAGRSFAVPTYLFSGVIILMIVTGLLREAFGSLPLYHPHAGVVTGTPSHSGLIAFGMVFVLLRAFANGGSSLTGIEAVSNAVSAFEPPEGINARRVLVTEGVILGSLVAGISWLAHVTHARPYTNGVPTVISQEARLVFGYSFAGTGLYILVQAATGADPLHRGQHQLQRLPVPGQLRGRGRLPAALADQARPPAGVLQRDHRARGAVVHPAGRHRSERQPPGAVLCDRRLHRLHPGRIRHGQISPHPPGETLAAQTGDQLLGGRDIPDRRADLRDGQVHRGRLAGGDPLRGRRARAHQAQPGIRAGGAGPGADQRPAQAAQGAELPAADRVRVRGQLRPGHDRCAALRPEPRPTTLRAVHFVIDTAQADLLRQEWTRAASMSCSTSSTARIGG